MKEIWKTVVGWRRYYEVSSLGRVRSLPRTIMMVDGRRRSYPGVILKQGLNPNGYPLVALARRGEKHTKMVHVLVARAFRGKRPPKHQTRHRDGKPLNCRAKNLKYGTPSQNSMDRVSHGTANRGERNGQSLLTKKQVGAIRRRYAAGTVLQRHLAEEYNVGANTISRIVNGVRWGWL